MRIKVGEWNRLTLMQKQCLLKAKAKQKAASAGTLTAQNQPTIQR
ncbi:hypothetical protein V7127_02425 [Bacillus sp. JJ1773]